MKNVKGFIIGLGISVLILISFFGGALADRIFVIKPLDAITQGGVQQAQNQQQSIASLPNLNIRDREVSVPNITDAVSPSVVTVAIKKQFQSINPFDFYGFGFYSPEETEVEEIQQDIGSGFVVEGNLIVTNRHVVSDFNAEYLVIDRDDNEYEVTDIYRDPDPANDLAILQVKDLNLPALELGNSDEIRVGESVIAIGTALGEFRHTVTVGVVSGLGRGLDVGGGFQTRSESLENVIQTDAAINPGNSGGPLINSQGKVIGVNVAKAAAENIGFAIPINVVKSSLDNFNQTGQFDRPFLGVGYFIIPKKTALYNNVPAGAYIERVVKNSSADEAGLQEGDIITEFDGQNIDEDNSLAELINNKKIGDKIKIKVFRDDEEIELNIKLKGDAQ